MPLKISTDWGEKTPEEIYQMKASGYPINYLNARLREAGLPLERTTQPLSDALGTSNPYQMQNESPVEKKSTYIVPKTTPPVDNSALIASTQSQITDLQAQANALKQYGLKDTQFLKKDASGNYIPRTNEEVYGGIIPGETPEEKELRLAQEARLAEMQTEKPDEAKIRADALSALQSEIDALDRLYAQKRADITREYTQKGVRRVGSQRALLAGAGMIGQVSGEAQKADLESANLAELTAAQNVVDVELQDRKAALLKEARTSAKEDYDKKLKAYSEGADAKIENIKTRITRKSSAIDKAVKNALLNGIDLSAKDSSYLEGLAKAMSEADYKVSANEILNVYTTEKKAYDAEQAKATAAKTKSDLEAKKLEAETKEIVAKTGKTWAEAEKLAAEKIKLETETPAKQSSTYRAELATTGRQAVKNLLTIAEKNKGIFGKTAATPIPDMLRSDAFRNYKAQLDYLKGNIIPSALAAMREASKTGGALGNVSDREGAWLASSLGALDMAQSPDAAINSLNEIDASLKRWQDAVNKETNDNAQIIPKGTDGEAYGFPGYVSDGTQWVEK